MTPQATPFQTVATTPVSAYNRQQFAQNGAAGMYTASQAQTSGPPAFPYTAHQQHNQPVASAIHPGSYAAPTHTPTFNRPAVTPFQTQPQYGAHAATRDQRHKEVYVLSDQANAAIPKEIRDRYPQDDQGRVLFFEKPPIDNKRTIEARFDTDKGKPLQHTEKYLKAKEIRDKLIADRKRRLDEEVETVNKPEKRLKPGFFSEERDADGRIKADPIKAAQIKLDEEKKTKEAEARFLADATKFLKDKYMEGLQTQYQIEWGSNWREYLSHDLKRGEEIVAEGQKEREETARIAAEKKKQESLTRVQKYEQELEENRKKGFVKDFWTGTYLDDTDPRLP